MARGTALATGTPNLLNMLKVEIGYNLTANVATAQDAELKQLLSQQQQYLWSMWQWPFLYTHEDIATVAGTRFYNDPATVSYDYPTLVEVKWGNIWYPVSYGISGEEYTVSDPDRNQTLDPIRKWQDKPSGTFEVWPVPSTGQTLRFWGTSVCAALSANGDVCTLDDLLIVLFTAAEKLKRGKQPDWQDKMAKAIQLFNRLKSSHSANEMFVMGGEDEMTYQRPTRVVAVASNTH